jgi:DNA (cytosine-5)-methyltransferase 1
MMQSLSLFSGIGGFDLGFERAGIETVAMCEKDKYALGVLKRHWPDIPIFDDVRDIDGTEFGTVDVIHGGFPCQDVSMAGKRKGLEGERSGLWWEFYRIVCEAMPKFVVIENVAGLLSSGGRRDLGAIIGALGKLGYLGGYRVLDSRYFGVAQRRRRVFIVASLGNDCGQKVLFESESLPGDFEKSGQEGKKDSGDALSGVIKDSKLLADSGVVSSLTKSFGGAGADAQHAQNGWLVPVAYSVTPKTGGGNELRAQEIDRANSLTAIGQHHDRGTKIVSDSSVRRLTPVECERLMGFPDDWTALNFEGGQVSNKRRYILCGNSIVVNVSEWLGGRIVSVSS